MNSFLLVVSIFFIFFFSNISNFLNYLHNRLSGTRHYKCSIIIHFTINYHVLSGLYTVTLPKIINLNDPSPSLPTSGSLPSLCVVNFRAGLSTPVLQLNVFIYLVFICTETCLCYFTYGAERPNCTY